jgi:hypothetical protein
MTDIITATVIETEEVVTAIVTGSDEAAISATVVAGENSKITDSGVEHEVPPGGKYNCEFGPEGLVYTRRSDYQEPYSYNGKAPLGSSEDGAIWTITRLTISADGLVTATSTVINQKWSEHLTINY